MSFPLNDFTRLVKLKLMSILEMNDVLFFLFCFLNGEEINEVGISKQSLTL